jgi:5'-deoxynucleotidase YfbR-like HD superfamily hydrolase
MQKSVERYVAGVSLSALLAFFAVYMRNPGLEDANVEASLLLTSLGIIAQLMVFALPSGAGGAIAFIPILALLILAPHWTTVVAVAVGYVIAESLTKRAPLKRIFNVAQMTLAISGGTLVYLFAGARPLVAVADMPVRDTIAILAPPFTALVIAFFCINTVAVSGAIAVSEGKSLGVVWRRNTLHAIAYDILAMPVVLLLAWTYAKAGAFGALCVSIPLFGVRQLYSTTAQLQQVNQELLQLMVKAIEARDPYTSGHSRRVAHYSKIIARAIGLSARRIERVATAALLHDVGKIHEVYAPILRKPDKLTADEWAVMQTHPIRSAELVSNVTHLRDLVLPLRHHHENWNGTGYPDGLAGENIPLESRIIMFADTIDAMTTDRPYRQARTEADVRAELIKERGRQFDPTICDRLLTSPLWGLLFAPTKREPTPIGSRQLMTLPRRASKVVGLSR